MRLMKRIGYALGGLVGLVVVAVAAAYGLSEMRFRRVYTVPSEQIAVSDDSATLARGAHLAATVGCADCHGEGLRGNAFIDAAPMGRLVALNLTKGEGGVGAQLTPRADRARACGTGSRQRAGAADHAVARLSVHERRRPSRASSHMCNMSNRRTTCLPRRG